MESVLTLIWMISTARRLDAGAADVIVFLSMTPSRHRSGRSGAGQPCPNWASRSGWASRAGRVMPMVLWNGIGASLEVLDQLVEQLEPETTVVRMMFPSRAGRMNSSAAEWFPYLAAVLAGCSASSVSMGGSTIGSVVGRRAGPTIRLPESAPLPKADPGVHRHGRRHCAGTAGRAREDADTAPVLRPRVRGRDRG